MFLAAMEQYSVTEWTKCENDSYVSVWLVLNVPLRCVMFSASVVMLCDMWLVVNVPLRCVMFSASVVMLCDMWLVVNVPLKHVIFSASVAMLCVCVCVCVLTGGVPC